MVFLLVSLPIINWSCFLNDTNLTAEHVTNCSGVNVQRWRERKKDAMTGKVIKGRKRETDKLYNWTWPRQVDLRHWSSLLRSLIDGLQSDPLTFLSSILTFHLVSAPLESRAVRLVICARRLNEVVFLLFLRIESSVQRVSRRSNATWAFESKSIQEI